MEYLYKVMKKKFYERALQFGELYFQSTLHLDKCIGYNKDVNENKTEIVEHFNVDGFSVDYSTTMCGFSYCFTANIDKYLTKYKLGDDYVILRFCFENVVNFFNNLALKDFAYGKISYHLDKPKLTFKDKLLSDDRKLWIMQHFIKTKEFELEDEFRFVCFPLCLDYMMYYSPLDNVLIGVGNEGRYRYEDLLVRLIPLLEIDNNRFYAANDVRRLFNSSDVFYSVIDFRNRSKLK